MPTRSVFWQRLLRIGGVVALAVLGVAIIVLGLFMLPPVRNAVLTQVVEKAKAHLPGEFAVAHASWPSVGAIGLEGVLWTANGDTLVAADTLIVEMSITSFFRRDLHAHRIVATGVTFDLPALRSSFPASTTSVKKTPKKERRFPRPGVIPGVPSVSAETIILRIHRARFTPQWTIVASDLEGACDLSAENGPKLSLTRLVASSLERKLDVQMTPFHFDGRAETMNGDLSARLDSLGTLVLHVASLPPDSLRLTATLEPDGDGTPLRVDVRGRLAWDGQRLQSYGFEGNLLLPGTEELARWPPPFRKAAVLSPLPPLTVRTEGVVTLRPQFSLNAHVTSKPAGWLEGLDIRGAYSDAGIQVDTLRAAFPGLRVTASGSRSRTALTALLDAQISDARWLKIVMPRFDPPESLVTDLHVAVDGPPSKPGLRVDLAGGFRRKALSVRDVTVSGQFPEGLRSPGTVNVSGVSRNLRVSTRAALVPRVPLEATLSPIRIEDLSFPGRRVFTVPRGAGTVRYDGSLHLFRAESVGLFGDWGTVHIDGNLTNGSGEAAVALECSTPPVFLRRFITLPDSTWSALVHRWEAEGPFTVNARSRIDGKRVSAEADFTLPGPSTLRAFLPQNAHVDDLGPLRGSIDAKLDTSWTTNVDLAATEWLLATPLHLEGSRSRIAVDSLRLGLDGLTISAAGSRENGIWAATGSLQLADARMVRRLVPGMTEKDSCTASVLVHVHDRDLIIEWTGAGRYHEFSLRHAAGHVFRNGGRWGLDLGANGLAMGTSLKLDRLSATLSTQADGREAVRFDCRGPTLAFATSGVVDRRNGFEASVDTLRLALSDKELHATQPFVVLARQHGNGFGFQDVDLEGTMGSVKGHGELRPGESLIDVRVALDLEGLSPPSPLVSAWWPEHLDISIANQGSDAISARASVAGLRLRGQSDWILEMTARGDTNGLTADAHLRSAAGEALSAKYFSPGVWQLYPFRVDMKPHLVEAEATLHEFPVPWQELGLSNSQIWPANANGHFVVNHDETGPYARGDLDVVLTPPDAKERPIRFTSQGVWIASSRQISQVIAGDATPLLEATEARLREMNNPGLVTSFALSRDTKSQLTGSLLARFVERPEGGFVLDPEHGIDLTASAPRFDLATLRAFLPPGYSLSGNLRLDARLTGSPRNPTLSGTVDAPVIALQMNDGGNIDAKGKLHYSGTLLAPVVEGRIDIKKGMIPVPEQPRKLHAVSGKALLWQTGVTTAIDSSLAEAVKANGAAADTTERFRPVYDLQVVVPSGLWIRGRNLNVELEGDLRLRQKHSVPTIVGNLEARQGTLNFVGRSFSLERGKVQFYGEDEINPGLDIRMNAKVSSTTAYITMSGTLKEPKIELTSSPAMSEADIMSLLVMGKTADDLNGDQAQLVAQRAAAVAATYGAAELQKKMAGPLGVDMITLNPGGGPEGENSVVVGKYLSPKALLKYEQALDSAAGFFVTLEYTLTETITLQTIAGTWQSGAEISWSKDY